MRVLITGVAGSIGRYLLKEIQRDPTIEPVLFDKNKKFLRRMKRIFHYETYVGDIRCIEDIKRATNNIDVVIHLLSIIPPLADEFPDLTYDVNVNGTRNLIDSLKEYSPDSFILYTSSISVYGDRLTNYNITINDKIEPSYMDYYGHTKVIAEELISHSGLNYSIFRLTGIMGVDTGKRGVKGSIMFHMPLSTRIEIATTRDTGYALYQSLFHRETISGRIFNLGGGNKCRIIYRDLLDLQFSAYGIKLSDLPNMSFATCNFHCGYYEDSNVLEKIFHFQRDSIESYKKWAIHKAPWIVRGFIKIFYSVVIKSITNKSEPLRAYFSKNHKDLKRFFGSKQLTV